MIVLTRAGAVFGLALCALIVNGQTFPGSNPPGGFSDYTLPVGVGATNLCLTAPGSSSAYSYLYLKRGSPPTDTNFDFSSTGNGQTNSINLEAPELQAATYYFRVRTPPGSLTHNFTVTALTNQVDARSTNRPITKALAFETQGRTTANSWQFFKVDITTNVPGWRVSIVNATNSNPDLYVQRGQLPTDTSFLKQSRSVTNDVLAFAGDELTPGQYYIGINQPASSATTNRYTLRGELVNFTTLNWDPGLTHLGTEVATNTTPLGGDYYFKITTINSVVGAWRTALNVSTGEAAVYLSKGTPPTSYSYQYRSERPGSDGFVVPSTAFGPGEDWYLLVQAGTNSSWTLTSGEPFVADLGIVAPDGSSGTNNVVMGAEGMRYFKTTLPVTALAWQLWLNGATNTILVKRTAVPHPTLTDLSQAAQMLVVPTNLVGGVQYFVGIIGDPGTLLSLDSRQHLFTDVGFSSSTTASLTGFGYRTYRVIVPPDQLAWQVSVVVSNGNPNVAVRRNTIPNEFVNDAYSEVASNVTDSITLVPAPAGSPPGFPGLGDGAYFVTVYGANASVSNSISFTLHSGNPEVTDINFVDTRVNTDTNRAGWRFFRVADIDQQLGALGWDLVLTNHSPGTRIALRRNAVPGIWTFRSPSAGSSGYHDFLSTGPFLQRPGHQADIWYIGVYNPTNALRGFQLTTRTLTADPINFDNVTLTRTDLEPGKWQYYRVIVPANTLGWDVRVSDASPGSQPTLVVRRDLLPTLPFNNIGFSSPIGLPNWPSGNQWVAAKDWTDRDVSADGGSIESGRVLTMGMGRPLEPATYYLGVINSSTNTNAMTFTLRSRGVGSGMSIPVTDLAFNGGSVSGVSLSPREVAYYRVTVPSNAPSWKVRLSPSVGDVVLAASRGTLPNITANSQGSVTNAQTAGKRMKKNGNEHLLLLPGNNALGGSGTNLIPGVYYLAVISEGQVVTNFPTRIGVGDAIFRLDSRGTMPEIDLGLLEVADIVQDEQLEGGEAAAFDFSLIPETLGFVIILENTQGYPVAVSRGTAELAFPGASFGAIPIDYYGNEGGPANELAASAGRIFVANPYPAETVMVKARSTGGDYPDAQYRLRIKRLVPQPLDFDGGAFTISDQNDEWRFFQVDVPTDALGWEVRLTDVQAGSPQIIVARGVLPILGGTGGFDPGNDTYWPIGARWAASGDWTRRALSPDGLVNEDSRILAMGMGRPLSPGTYFVGVRNFLPGTTTCQYTLRSQGIGGAYSIPVRDLSFDGGVHTNLDVAPRVASYYRVLIPQDKNSWQLKLTSLAGESMLMVLTNNVPSVVTGYGTAAGREMHRLGNDHYVLLTEPVRTNLSPGSNYLAVISEGVVGTNSSRIGTGVSSFKIESLGEMEVVQMGMAAATDLVHTASLEGGQVRGYQFNVPPNTLSLEVRLEYTNGTASIAGLSGPYFPDPGAPTSGGGAGAVTLDKYGNQGGYTITPNVGNANARLLTFANPTSTVYSVVVKNRDQFSGSTNWNYTLRVRAIPAIILQADGGSYTVTNQLGGTWRYFRVDVPPEALGWDIRLANVGAGQPRIVVRREAIPIALSTIPWSNPGSLVNWPVTNQWAPVADWTRRSLPAVGTASEDGRILAVGMGRPLEAGTYYIGVINPPGVTNAMSYTIRSRLIGDGFILPVVELPFEGGSATNLALTPREADYYRVVIPPNTPSWKVRVASTGGELMLITLPGSVPNIDSGTFTVARTGKAMQKAGNEHYVLLPDSGATNVIPGTYFLAVVGEGQNPSANNRIGTGASSYELTSEGPLTPVDLGTVGSVDLVDAGAIEGGECAAYRFRVPPGILGLEMRLENRVGNPILSASTTFRLPDPGAPLVGQTSPYGNEGGTPPYDQSPFQVVVPNASTGLYHVIVKARPVGTAYPDASFTIRVRNLVAPELSFSPEWNVVQGGTNRVTGTLQDNQRTFYRFDIPPVNLDGSPVVGWELNLSQSSGLATVRARKDFLPGDLVSTGMVFTPYSAVLAPPFLTNGTWYVEVRGSNTTSFELTSRSLLVQRPAWDMPMDGGPVTTPGLTAPDFGDTGVDPAGTPLPGDQGVDLQQGYYHYYAVNVPTNNIGVLRVQLEAISGNPDYYVRVGNAPTASHATDGRPGVVTDRSLTGTTTEYANWVPFSGRTNSYLPAGRYYMAVRAAGSATARYRLRLSTGNVTELPSNGSLTNQIVAGGDWRYYRVRFPFEAPTNWTFSFTQLSGDVALHIRDTVPPGNGASTNTTTELKDWVADNKNTFAYTNYDQPGAYTVGIPPIRPGSSYYLGFRAKNDATFNVSSTTSGGTLAPMPTIDFYGGTTSNTIPPLGQVFYRIFVPPDGSRWKHTSTHPASVSIYIENGLPPRTNDFDYKSTVPNSSLNQFLGGWPWVPNNNYFMMVVNSSNAPMPFSLIMDGKNVVNDDNDNDGLPDMWEVQNFGNTTSQTGSSDFDRDGVNNLSEYLEGTNPSSAASLRPRLTVLATNGVVTVNPLSTNYALGTLVTLTATPNAGFLFAGWSSNASGLANPLALVLTSNRTVIAKFRVPGDDFDIRIPLSGIAADVSAVNTGATKEPGEPNHWGTPGGKSIWWTWTAPYSGTARISAVSTNFGAVLAVYSGSTVSNLTEVASDFSSGGANTSVVNFPVVSGASYEVAVDGVGGSFGAVLLSLSMPGLFTLDAPTAPGDGTFQFNIIGQPGQSVEVQFSTNLTTWNTLTTITNATGTISFSDPGASAEATRFYRARVP